MDPTQLQPGQHIRHSDGDEYVLVARKTGAHAEPFPGWWLHQLGRSHQVGLADANWESGEWSVVGRSPTEPADNPPIDAQTVIAAYLANSQGYAVGEGWEQRCEDAASEIVDELLAVGALVDGQPAPDTDPAQLRSRLVEIYRAVDFQMAVVGDIADSLSEEAPRRALWKVQSEVSQAIGPPGEWVIPDASPVASADLAELHRHAEALCPTRDTMAAAIAYQAAEDAFADAGPALLAEVESLRATVARLRAAADDLTRDTDTMEANGSCIVCGAHREHMADCSLVALRAALDATTAEPTERLARVLDQVDARVVFWCCPIEYHRGVEWTSHEDRSMTPMCKTCGKVGPTYPATVDVTTGPAPEPTRTPLATVEGTVRHSYDERPEGQGCRCCPGAHVFARHIEGIEGAARCEWLYDQYRTLPDGIRVEVQVFATGPPAVGPEREETAEEVATRRFGRRRELRERCATGPAPQQDQP